MFGIPSTQPNLFSCNNVNENENKNKNENKNLNKSLFTFKKESTPQISSGLFDNKPIFNNFNNYNDYDKSQNTTKDPSINTINESSDNTSFHTSLNSSFNHTFIPKSNNIIENSNNENSNNENSNNEYNNIENTNIEHNRELTELKNTIEDLKKNIDEIKNFTKLQIKNNYETGIYVKCNKHNHLLKECTINDLSNIYSNGFCCDYCKYRQQNISEKFYHCDECSSICGLGNYDLCFNCVNNSI